MRQAIITLLLALALVLGLSGCTDNKDTSTNSKARSYNDYNYGTNDRNGTNYNNGTNKNNNYNYDTNNNSAGSELKRETEDLLRGRSYDEMLRNGRINDTDGILTDGENSISR